ncbi:uncharacterized protein MONBRDRAFT_11744 [Monosiga brevicollis MX1]|uniref:Uncharacterized protein n=1 Tax=Monosiga brevicollis TaxID=81824 RepID=A9VA59_MONBE|nr:uncharacterized protein MONBRDRAFT_11744 [Monosiga brevicollis MX1]EDQ85609.1 predicted protein [Monosiga brevicollis MX1]|eukprot:XP_001749558.1 hypothetical protein [Monosiga brevicollis MX1]
MAGTDSTHYFRPSAPILHNEVDARSKDGEPAILVAIRLDALDLLRELLQRGVNLLCTDQHLRNAVTIACIYLTVAISPKLRSTRIAQWAVRLASPELVRYLVRLDSFQLLRKTARGFGVLHLMVKEGRTDVRFLAPRSTSLIAALQHHLTMHAPCALPEWLIVDEGFAV